MAQDSDLSREYVPFDLLGAGLGLVAADLGAFRSSRLREKP
jgi:hypothetical protein